MVTSNVVGCPVLSGRTKEQVENGSCSVIGVDLNPDDKPCVTVNERVYDKFPADKT